MEVSGLAQVRPQSCPSKSSPGGACELSPALQRWGRVIDDQVPEGRPTLKRSANRPLSGLRVLVGRARHQASQLSHGLKKLGADIIEIPFIEIRPPRSYKPLDQALKQIDKYDWLILTSVNGVNALADRTKRLRMSPEAFRHAKIAAIGPATCAQIEGLGLKVAIVPKRYVAESVVESLRGKIEGKRVLLARAKVARDVIPLELRKMSAKVDVIEAYETIVPASSKKRLRAVMKNPALRPDVVCFTSSSTVRSFAELLGLERSSSMRLQVKIRSGGTTANSPALQRREPTHKNSSPVGTAEILSGVEFASIGPITSATVREFDLPVRIEAKEYTIPGLIRAISQHDPRA
jgi:uroporphyrinogen-III synthase